MFKVRMNRFFAVIAVLFCIGVNVSAEVKFNGAVSERVVVDSETFKLSIDFESAKYYYIDYNHWGKEDDEKTKFKLIVGGCQIEMWAEQCEFYGVHIRVGKRKNKRVYNALDYFRRNKNIMISFNAVVSKDAITVEDPRNDRHYWRGHIPCNVQFHKISTPGRYVVDVSLTGPNIAPKLVTTIDGERFTTTTSPTTTTIQASTTTTQAPTTTLMSTTTPVPIITASDVTSTTVKTLSCSQYEDRGLQPWLIGLIIAAIILALLAIALCAAIFCSYRHMQKSKVQSTPKSQRINVKSTVNTVSTAPGPLIKETNQYGPDMMYFGRNATPADPNAKNQAANPAPQIASSAPDTRPMQTPQ